MNWLHHLWFGYFVPSLWGNGPEAIVQTVLYGAAALFLIPPVRRWFMAHVVEHLKQHITTETQALHVKLDEAHAKIDHVILHSKDIPAFGSDAVVKPRRPRKVGLSSEVKSGDKD